MCPLDIGAERTDGRGHLTAAQPPCEARHFSVDERVRGWQLGGALRERPLSDRPEMKSTTTNTVKPAWPTANEIARGA
jgi:hypothetical protein